MAEGCDPGRVVATGPGLQAALTEKTNNFNIITRYRCSVRDEPARQPSPIQPGLCASS